MEQEIRITHDATYEAEVNHKIRVRDQCRCPVAPDAKRQLKEQSKYAKVAFGLSIDVDSAHKVVMVAEQDWAFQACSTAVQCWDEDEDF